MIKLLLISGSPVDGSSVEILLNTTAESFVKSFKPEQVQVELIKLNDLTIGSCQACGKSPQPDFCFFEDGMTDLYQKLISCDCVIVGSPIYFDTVSAQLKLFIDRSNCMRPGDFSKSSDGNQYLKLLEKKRQGGIVLVGGERGYFEGARRVIAGFFKWTRIVNHGVVTFGSNDMRLTGTVQEDQTALGEATKLGEKLAHEVQNNA